MLVPSVSPSVFLKKHFLSGHAKRDTVLATKLSTIIQMGKKNQDLIVLPMIFMIILSLCALQAVVAMWESEYLPSRVDS